MYLERPAASATTCPNERRSTPVRRAGLVGTGLIGGSVGLALRSRRLARHRDRPRPGARRHARSELGVVDEIGIDPDAELTFVAVPVSAVPDGGPRGARRAAGW